MLSKKWMIVLATAVAPVTWGSTYIVTTELLPDGTPLLDAVLRALPAGLLLLIVTRRLPRGAWWWKASVLGVLNIGAFFALLFVGAYLLPGGVAATIGALQPLVVSALASRLIGERFSRLKIIAGAGGVLGVGLLVLQAQARLDLLGVLAALGGTLVMAVGVVLSKKWGQPAPPLVTTSWQLIAGGLFLVPVLLLVEGLPTTPITAVNILGFAYLALVGTALAYVLWFRGIQLLPVGATAFLGLLASVVASLLGWIVLEQTLAPGQLLGIAIVLVSVAAVFVPARQSPAPPPLGSKVAV